MSSAGDRLILESLRTTTLSHWSDAEWGRLTKEVERVGGVTNLEGFARDAIIEALKKAQSFEGDRSAAGRYAANMRWQKRRAAAAAPPPDGDDPKKRAGRKAAAARWAKKKPPVSETNEERKPRRYAGGDAETRAKAIKILTRRATVLERDLKRAERSNKPDRKALATELRQLIADNKRMLDAEMKDDELARSEGR